MSILGYLERTIRQGNLTAGEARTALNAILSGEASIPQIAAWLVALRMKGETAAELTGFAMAMRERMVPVDPGAEGGPLVDTCGTGGDGGVTFNISTVSAFVVAAAGARVAKHGNRSISSKCGSADLLEMLGVNISLDAAQMGEALQKVGIGFLFAPVLHPAMRHAQPARLELKIRTVFNMLGPLANPAGAPYQLVGAYSDAAASLMAEALAALGCRRGFVVHAEDGLDEITTTGPTRVWHVNEGRVEQMRVTPEDFGIPQADIAELRGGTREENCESALRVLEGEPGPRRDIVLVNASAALVAAGLASSFREGVSMAAAAIDSGAASRKVQLLAHFSQQAATAGTAR